MPKICLLKVHTSYGNRYGDDYAEVFSFEKDHEFKEMTDAEMKKLQSRVEMFNSNQHLLKPIPGYFLLVVEGITLKSTEELFSEVELLVQTKKDKAAAAALKRKAAAEKKKLLADMNSREAKLAQLEKLKKELDSMN